ncbi:MAG: hypothetical protein J1F64_06675 [Oscillospiraceae bacterium]|nr:hypothetical protein [Oscillospiraceae bacterium]
MKNRKIIALLCAMAMIITTMSSIFMFNVSAAGGMNVSVNVSPEVNADGTNTVSVDFSGFENRNIASITMIVPLDETKVEFVSATPAPDVHGTVVVNYDTDAKAVKLAAFSVANDVIQTASGTLFTFNVKLKEGVDSVDFELKEKSSKIDEYTTDADGNEIMRTYRVGGEGDEALDATSDTLEYDKGEVAGEPRFVLSKSKSDDVYTITVSYDISTLPVKSIGSATIAVGLNEDEVEVVSYTPDPGVKGTVVLNHDTSTSVIKLAAFDVGNNVFDGNEKGDLFTFEAKLKDGVTKSKITFDTLKIDAVDDTGATTTYSLKAGNVSKSASVTLSADEKPSESDAPTTPPTETDEPTTPPAGNVKYPVTVDVVPQKTALGQNGYKVILSEFADADKPLPDYVDVVIQGWSKANPNNKLASKNSTVGYVVISNIDTKTMGDAELSGYVPNAKGVSVSVLDSSKATNIVGETYYK